MILENNCFLINILFYSEYVSIMYKDFFKYDMSKKEDNKDDNSTMPCIKIVPKTELYSSESYT